MCLSNLKFLRSNSDPEGHWGRPHRNAFGKGWFGHWPLKTQIFPNTPPSGKSPASSTFYLRWFSQSSWLNCPLTCWSVISPGFCVGDGSDKNWGNRLVSHISELFRPVAPPFTCSLYITALHWPFLPSLLSLWSAILSVCLLIYNTKSNKSTKSNNSRQNVDI